jgi:alpha-glucosidase
MRGFTTPPTDSRRKRRRSGKFALLLCLAAICQTDGAFASSPIRFAGLNAELFLTVVSSNTVRVTLIPKGVNPEELDLTSNPVLVPRNWPEPAFKLSEVSRTRTIKIGEWRVQVASEPLAIDIFNRAGRLVQRLVFDERKGEGIFRLGEAPLFGLGGGGPQFDKRGTFDAMNNGHRAGEFQIFGSRVPVPLLLSPEGWGLFFHRPYRGSFDLRGTEGHFEARAGTENPRETALPLDVFVILADSPPGLLAEYSNLTGKPALPPKWALGYMQSHRTLAGPEEVLQINPLITMAGESK